MHLLPLPLICSPWKLPCSRAWLPSSSCTGFCSCVMELSKNNAFLCYFASASSTFFPRYEEGFSRHLPLVGPIKDNHQTNLASPSIIRNTEEDGEKSWVGPIELSFPRLSRLVYNDNEVWTSGCLSLVYSGWAMVKAWHLRQKWILQVI